MNWTFIKKWTTLTIGITVFIGLTSLTWVEYQLRKGRGQFTQKVDRTQFSPLSGLIAIENVTILSPDCESMIAGQTVLLDNGKILAIGPAIQAPQNAHRLDGENRFLIPGLVDSHIHLENTPNDLLLYLANGVTHVRDMGGAKHQLKMRQDTLNGHLGPHMFIASEKIYSDSGLKGRFSDWTRTRINISKPEEAAPLAERLTKAGFDAVKISNGTHSDVFWALMSASKKYNLPAVGHIPDNIPLPEFWESGQIEIAHVEELTKALAREFGGYHGGNANDFVTFVETRAEEVAREVHDHNIAVTTTTWLMQSIPKQKFDLETTIKQTALPYANPALIEGTLLRKGWLPGNNSYGLSAETQNNPEALASARSYWEAYVQAIHIMTRALVKNDVFLMAGTDANTALVVPGFSLHDELQDLTRIGLSNAQALRSATVNPGIWLKSNSGRIEPGYKADLVLLDKNPLEDIANTQTIRGVFVDGQYLNRALLDAMLSAVKKANDKSRNSSIDHLH